jgi:ribosomal protein S18 acetylase RimI-like enzyme
MDESREPVTLRAATSGDHDFLLALFANTRSDELEALGWDPIQTRAFIQMQYQAQQQNYSACYPAAENNIIVLAEQPIGRILVDRRKETIRLLDIAILAEYRNKGIGSSLIRDLLAEATAAQKPLRLSVYKLNPALRLYERMGFLRDGEEALYIQMQYLPAPASARMTQDNTA